MIRKKSQCVANATAIPIEYFKMFLMWCYTHWNRNDARSFCFHVKFIVMVKPTVQKWSNLAQFNRNGCKMLLALWPRNKKTEKMFWFDLIDKGMGIIHQVFVFEKKVIWSYNQLFKNDQIWRKLTKMIPKNHNVLPTPQSYPLNVSKAF